MARQTRTSLHCGPLLMELQTGKTKLQTPEETQQQFAVNERLSVPLEVVWKLIVGHRKSGGFVEDRPAGVQSWHGGVRVEDGMMSSREDGAP